MPVKHQCLITFSLGKNYFETLHCNVIPMIASHLLLGHPWLYDRRVNYDGYRNTYSCIFSDRKIKFQPMLIHNFETNAGEDRILTLWYFTTKVQESGIIFALVSRDYHKPVEIKPLQMEIQALLNEFRDITSKELPRTLLPTRDIQHAINLAQCYVTQHGCVQDLFNWA